MIKYKTNELIKQDDHAELIIYSANSKKKFISLLDLEDVPYVKQYCWCMRSGDYVGRVEDKETIRLHRVLANAKDDEVVDHINRNKLDNRKQNLRVCTFQENIFNSKKSTRNTSGVIGVGYRKDIDQWRAHITIDYKYTTIGCFKKKEDAIIARLKAEKDNFGEFAPQRKLFKKYNI